MMGVPGDVLDRASALLVAFGAAGVLIAGVCLQLPATIQEVRYGWTGRSRSTRTSTTVAMTETVRRYMTRASQ